VLIANKISHFLKKIILSDTNIGGQGRNSEKIVVYYSQKQIWPKEQDMEIKGSLSEKTARTTASYLETSLDAADTVYLPACQIPCGQEILFQGEIPGIFAEEAVRNHSFSMVSRHFHESLELYFLLEGERFYFVEQDTYHVRDHMGILVDQNQIHKTCPAGTKTRHHRFLLQLEGRALSEIIRLCGFQGLPEFGEQYRGIIHFSESEWNQVLKLLERIKSELSCIGTSERFSGSEAEKRAAEGMIRLYTAQLLLLLIRVRGGEEAQGWREPRQSSLVHTGMYQKVHEIAIYLQNNSARKLCLDDLAAHFFISRSYLTRIFRTVTGFTVSEYQNICRIKKAQILLRETSMSITEISMETGFGSLPYFERVFRQTAAQTPLQYRQSVRKRVN
jgi:AraC-like DNA-binding protein